MFKKNLKFVMIGIFTSLGSFFLFSIPTALINNPFFKRMTPVTKLDLILLVIISLMLGIYVSLHFYLKYKNNKCSYYAIGGAFTGVFAFTCPICNILLVAVFGSTALLTYFEPYRPLLGVVAIVLIGFAIFLQIKIKKV
jgi:hypothetical protein